MKIQEIEGTDLVYHSTSSANLESIKEVGLRGTEWEDEELNRVIDQPDDAVIYALFYSNRPQDEYGDVQLRFNRLSPQHAEDAYSPDRGSFFWSPNEFLVHPFYIEMFDGTAWKSLV